MTGRFRNHIVLLLLCLSVLPKLLRAQGYTIPDRPPYHAASIYYVTLQNADGVPVNSQYADVEGAIGAFVGSELRGTSQWMTTVGNDGIFMVRVWGDNNDPATATFRLHDQLGLEYQISSQPFAKGEEGNYGTPSNPIAMTITPVTGISLPFTKVTLKQAETTSAKPTMLPANHSTLLTDVQYTYSSDAAAFTVSSNGIITGVGVGQGIVTVKVTPGNFTAQATVNVEAGIPYVAVTEIKNNMTSNTLTMTEGDKLTLNYSVLPDNATNKAVSFKNNYSIIDIQQETETSLPTLIAKKAGKDTLTVIAADNEQITLTYYINVKERVIPDITLTFASQQLTASKLHDTTLTLSKGANDEVVADRVELVFPKASNGEPVATATMADATGLKWNVRGQYVGQYTVKVKYNGKEQSTTCTVSIPGEITFRNGWDWISLYTTAAYPLTNNSGDYLQTLTTNDKNRIIEIRSQQATVFYDATFGHFGDLKELTATDGAYKIKSIYEDENEATKVFNIGTTPGGKDIAAKMPQVESGYTWIGYPHERDHKLATLQKNLAATANEGDMIIGREAFLEYDGAEWKGSLKTFEAGKGYIYYTKATKPFRLDWGDYYMASDIDNSVAAREMAPIGNLNWQYDALQYASSMPVVAQLTNGPVASGTAVGAFFNGECRGYAFADSQGLLFLSVTGNAGERISFMLCDVASGCCYETEQTVTFGTPKGSLRAPLMLSVNPAGISIAQAAPIAITFDGTDISVSGASAQQPLTVSVYNMAGRNVLTTVGHSIVSLAHLAKGIYAVKATCGRTTTTIKIAK